MEELGGDLASQTSFSWQWERYSCKATLVVAVVAEIVSCSVMAFVA